eukprot:scaffold1509_cov240-Pinguiococcus_pyrenoidosus.AAC.37
MGSPLLGAACDVHETLFEVVLNVLCDTAKQGLESRVHVSPTTRQGVHHRAIGPKNVDERHVVEGQQATKLEGVQGAPTRVLHHLSEPQLQWGPEAFEDLPEHLLEGQGGIAVLRARGALLALLGGLAASRSLEQRPG